MFPFRMKNREILQEMFFQPFPLSIHQNVLNFALSLKEKSKTSFQIAHISMEQRKLQLSELQTDSTEVVGIYVHISAALKVYEALKMMMADD